MSPLKKDLNKKILDTLENEGDMQRDNLVSILKEPRTTVYDHISELMNMEMIKSYKLHEGKRGRPLVLFTKVKEFK
jgi:predicted ArsR family transcriptional regulator